VTRPDSAATRAVRAARERATAGWSWETNSRERSRLIAQTLAVKGTVCHLCGTDGADTADHLLPRSAGGANELANLAPAHRACNTQRGTMPLTVWFARHPLPHRQPLTPSREW
jgi:5-methylcytosine-specific restriction endonuclease McrA